MTINEQEARAIAFVAARCRPHGASAWDEAGIVANIRKVAHLNLAEVALATIRAAANRQADNPGVIPNLGGEHWREKVAERNPWRPPRRDETCRNPGHEAYPANNCAACATEGRESEYGSGSPVVAATTRKADATTAADQIRARLGWAREEGL